MVVRSNPPFTLPVVTKFLVMMMVVCRVEQSLGNGSYAYHCIEGRCLKANVTQRISNRFPWHLKLLNSTSRTIDISQGNYAILRHGVRPELILKVRLVIKLI